ncbi:hypothetical protein [Kibdelosporangium aridum]|uniref:hypothetical protein n=1 Tax=Kibdelosporangium aridum TaxID=2030 RepID=UPI0036D35264
MHGRHAELAAVLTAARTHTGRLVVVRGAPGTGRTALLTAAGHALRDTGMPVAAITDPTELSRLRPRRTALLIDDADAVPIQDLLACRRNGCLVIATCRDISTSELSAAADHTLDLGPLPDADVLTLLKDVGPLDQPVIDALRTALGPLFGNPGTVLATVEHLRDRLITVAERLCLRELHIALPPHHWLCTRDDPLLTAVAILGELRIDDLPMLAAALSEPVADCGRRIDALVEADVLTVDTTGKLRCVCPALAAALADDAGPHHAQRLHHALAVQLMRRNGDPTAIADHLTASGLSTPTARLLRLADRARTQQPHRLRPEHTHRATAAPGRPGPHPAATPRRALVRRRPARPAPRPARTRQRAAVTAEAAGPERTIRPAQQRARRSGHDAERGPRRTRRPGGRGDAHSLPHRPPGQSRP